MKLNKKVVRPVFFTTIYMVYGFCLMKYLYSHDLLIGLNSINTSNIGIKLLDDFLSSLLIVIIIISITLIKKQPLKRLGLTKNNSTIVAILFLAYIGIFFVKGDFSLIGIYKCFFYLIIVSFSEELVFRGYLFTELEREIPTYLAVIISGMMWGAMHASIPIIVNNYTLTQALNAIVSQLGGGVLVGGIFILVYKKSKSLPVTILIHALLDFSSVLM